ncbi:hypothetical protein RvY_06719-2 [Ramazzottius varieornatus]|uniref:G-protein coupled receptors family 1 profile domain-containing protein n=1 Tax=Ramazzottius varieornatus TaxID=947166 RepID=A0A1D1UZI5_RAMVA|nr:hypothetical protein RvY_06719-2 [Ramazzottius varieornatus]
MDLHNISTERTTPSAAPHDHIRQLFEKHFLSSASGDEAVLDAEQDSSLAVNGKSLQDFLALLASVNRNTSDEQDVAPASPLEMSVEEQAFFMCLYGAAIVLAVGGNLAVILVFLFGRRWKSDLSIFLVNLAFSDIVLSVFCMPFTMSQVVKHHWQFPDLLCPIVLFLQLSSVIASVFTLMAIGVDRYLFVTRPLKARLTKRKGKFVIGMIWILALTFSSIQLSVVRCSKFIHNQVEYKDCHEDWPTPTVRQIYTVALALLTYLMPLAVLIYVYICVGRILWQRNPPGETLGLRAQGETSSSFLRSQNGLNHLSIPAFPKNPLLTVQNLSSAQRLQEERLINSKQRVVKMLVVIVLVFAICWFPLHLFFLAIDFLPESIRQWREELDEQSFTYTFLAIHFLAMSSSYVNPIIYSFMNQNFRVRPIYSKFIQIIFQSGHFKVGKQGKSDDPCLILQRFYLSHFCMRGESRVTARNLQPLPYVHSIHA